MPKGYLRYSCRLPIYKFTLPPPKTAAMAAATHVVQRQVEKAMEKAEPTAGRRSHAYAGVIPLDMRIG